MISEAFLEELCRRFGLTAAAVGVVREGSHWTWAGPGGSEAPTVDSCFYLASVSKAYTATAVALAVAEGAMAFDRPAAELVPEAAYPRDGGCDAPTLRDLLGMRSGLATAGAAHFGFAAHLPVEERVRRIKFARHDKPLRYGFGYHNIGPIVARLALERATGQTISGYLQKKLFDALGMERTYDLRAAASNGAVPPTLRGGDGSVQVPLVVGENSLGAGGFFGSIADAVAWMRFQLDPASLLTDPKALVALAETQAPQALDLAGPKSWDLTMPWLAYGMGWFVGHAYGSRVLFHGGNVPGCGALVLMLPDHKLGVACYVAGHVSSARYIGASVLEQLLGTPVVGEAMECQVLDGVRPAQGDPAAVRPPSGIAGRYRNPEAGELTLADYGDGLEAHYELCPMYDGKLVFADNRMAEVRFDSPALRHNPEPEPAAAMRFASDGRAIENDWLGRFERLG